MNYELIISLIAVCWMLICAFQDWKQGEVSNWLTIPAMTIGMIYAAFMGSERLILCAATLVGLALLYILGGIGGADVKVLVALAGIWRGSNAGSAVGAGYLGHGCTDETWQGFGISGNTCLCSGYGYKFGAIFLRARLKKEEQTMKELIKLYGMLEDRKGATMAEYAVIAAVLILVAIVAFTSLGSTIVAKINDLVSNM